MNYHPETKKEEVWVLYCSLLRIGNLAYDVYGEIIQDSAKSKYRPAFIKRHLLKELDIYHMNKE